MIRNRKKGIKTIRALPTDKSNYRFKYLVEWAVLVAHACVFECQQFHKTHVDTTIKKQNETE